MTMPEPDPDRQPLPVGAATPGQLCGSGFNDGREPARVTWVGEPVARPPRRWESARTG